MPAGNMTIRRLGEAGDLGWVVMAHGEFYASELGWDTSFEVLVAKIVADYAGSHDDVREAAWIAEGTGGGWGACSASRLTSGPRSCASCWSIRAPGDTGLARGWSTNA